MGVYWQRHDNKIAYRSFIQAMNFYKQNKLFPKSSFWELLKTFSTSLAQGQKRGILKRKTTFKNTPPPLKKTFLGIWAWWGRPFDLGTSSGQPGRGGGKGDNIDVSVQKDDHVLTECQGMWEMLRTSCTHAVGYRAMCLLNTVTWSDCRLDPVYSMFQP